jgi:outer membrane protein assembly factor BamE (lipoprotein component of BamABCDE complex)
MLLTVEAMFFPIRDRAELIPRLKLFPFIIMSAIALSGCATAPPSAPHSRTKEQAGDESEKPPFVGMTKGQVLARYGEPKRHTITDEGEQWVYLLNFGEVMGKALIPFNFSPTPIRTGVIVFGPDGRVKKFNWDTPTDG